MQNCKSSPAPIVKGDRYKEFQCLRNQYEIDHRDREKGIALLIIYCTGGKDLLARSISYIILTEEKKKCVLIKFILDEYLAALNLLAMKWNHGSTVLLWTTTLYEIYKT